MPIDKDGNEKAAEVKFHYWDYGTREGVSEIQVFRNFETALKQAGFTVVYEDSPGIITATRAVPGTCSTTRARSTTRPSSPRRR